MPTKYALPEYSRADVNRAGRLLAAPPLLNVLEWEWALDVINNWRAAHGYPLNALAMNLRNRARKLTYAPLLAQRLKRLRSIQAKLRRFSTMRLTQVQDIGGCRAVLPAVYDVERLVRTYAESDAKNPHRHQRIGFDDYVNKPKDDGYRGVHIIYEYRSRTPQTRIYDGLRIEVQIRSQLQHAWATAVETVDTFTGQALKADSGTEEWQRFFAVMGSVLARREGTPWVTCTPANEATLLRELADLARHLDVRTKLLGWRAAIQHIEQNATSDDAAYLLVLDTQARRLKITGFASKDLARASKEYAGAERNAQANAVLVTVDSLAALPAAYPNYYMDTEKLLDALQLAIDEARYVK